MVEILAIDVEGNGATPPEIVELCVLQVVGRHLTGRMHHWFFRPDKPITPVASRIHGITDDDVRHAPAISDVADQLIELLGDIPILGHNVRVDLDALSRSLESWRPSNAFDTLKLARALQPGLESYGLAKLGAHFGLQERAAAVAGGRPHSAPFDAALSALLFDRLLEGLDEDAATAAIENADILAEPKGSLL